MKKDYDAICVIAPEFKKHAFKEFIKIRCLINSRIFRIKQKGETCDAVVPFADMINYKYGNNMTHWEYMEQQQEFVIAAIEDIKKDQEVFFNCDPGRFMYHTERSPAQSFSSFTDLLSKKTIRIIQFYMLILIQMTH